MPFLFYGQQAQKSEVIVIEIESQICQAIVNDTENAQQHAEVASSFADPLNVSKTENVVFSIDDDPNCRVDHQLPTAPDQLGQATDTPSRGAFSSQDDNTAITVEVLKGSSGEAPSNNLNTSVLDENRGRTIVRGDGAESPPPARHPFTPAPSFEDPTNFTVTPSSACFSRRSTVTSDDGNGLLSEESAAAVQTVKVHILNQNDACRQKIAHQSRTALMMSDL
jgi:hypothetical protein